MSDDIKNKLLSRLAPDGYKYRTEIEATYPPRPLPGDALVTRIAPSPTGFVHLGTVYAALINYRLSRQSGGVFLLRLEDTDKKREAAGAKDQIISSLNTFGLIPDESPAVNGSYGPYVQSERRGIYFSYAAELLGSGRAYPCFATPEELSEIYERQKAAKTRPGYYGQFAMWRDRSDSEILEALEANKTFVLRFKSLGSHTDRLEIHDELKGQLSLPCNDLDVPLIKGDGLPTYHLAHVVDDHLMRINLVLRGDEWLPSTPLHAELAAALDIPLFRYAHFAPISVNDGSGKRKMSKRKDPEADVNHWLDAGYPADAILTYLTTLAGSDYESWQQQNRFAPLGEYKFSLAKLAMSRAPLFDPKKLTSISRDVIAEMPQPDYESQLKQWLSAHDTGLLAQFDADPAYSSKVLSLEREGANRRKDLAVWAEARELYFYFFDELYKQRIDDAMATELAEIDFLTQKVICDSFLSSYSPLDDQPTWLEKFRTAASSAGFAPDSESLKASPDKYKGGLAQFAKVIRVRLTTRNRSPDLFIVMQILGENRVRSRLGLD